MPTGLPFTHANATRVTALLLLAAFLPWSVALPASAVTFPGTAVALVAPEQRIRENSTAVPVLGFSFSSTGSEALDNITVSFGGSPFYSGDNRTLRTLSRDSGVSGVGLYRDSGATDDYLDPADAPLYLDDIFWSGNNVRMVLANHTEFIPASPVGAYGWFIVVRTGQSTSYLADGGSFFARLFSGAIVATNVTGFVALPSLTVTTNSLFVRHTKAVNLVTAATSYVGPGTAAVHERAVLGLLIVDGTNDTTSGVHDQVTGLDLRITQMSGSVGAPDFAPIVPESAVSGVGMYRDDGAVNDEWDLLDTPIRLGSIEPDKFGGGSPGGVTLRITFNPPLLAPWIEGGLFEWFFVVRTGTISSADSMRFSIVLNSVGIDGLLPTDRGRTAMASVNTSSATLYGDDTGPVVMDFWWGASGSPFVTAVTPRRLVFNHDMVSPVRASAFATLSDPGAGLMNMSWGYAVGIGGPLPDSAPLIGNSFTILTYYEVGPTSTSGAQAIDLVAFDRVGNRASALEQAWNLTYTYDPRTFAVEPAPGWYAPAGDGIYIDAAGTLWFSDQISGNSTAWIGANVTALYGGRPSNITASVEPQLMAPTNLDDAYGAANFSQPFTTQYGFWANSSQGRGAVTIRAVGPSGTLASLDLPIREDNAPPTVSLNVSRVQGAGGETLTITATAADTGSGMSSVWIEQRPDGRTFALYSDGQGHYSADLAAAQLVDGLTQIAVFAADLVGNVGADSTDIIVRTSGIETDAPRVSIVSPQPGAVVSGTAVFDIAIDDASALAAVWARVDEGEWTPLTADPVSGRYTFTWDTSAAADGPHALSAGARDAWGNEAMWVEVRVTVDNSAPEASLAVPLAGSTLGGTTVIRVFADDDVGISKVTLEIDGTTVPMAFNSASGYYEFPLDTRTLADGEHQLVATVVDENGHREVTEPVTFKIQNRDDMGAVIRASPFLIFLFAVAAFVATVLLVRKGAVGRWMGGGRGKAASGDKPAGPSEKDLPSKPHASQPLGPGPAPPSGASAPAAAGAAASSAESLGRDQAPCPTCGATVGIGWKFCPRCKQELTWG